MSLLFQILMRVECSPITADVLENRLAGVEEGRYESIIHVGLVAHHLICLQRMRTRGGVSSFFSQKLREQEGTLQNRRLGAVTGRNGDRCKPMRQHAPRCHLQLRHRALEAE